MLIRFVYAVALGGLLWGALPSLSLAQSEDPPLPEVIASASAERGIPADLAKLTLRFSRVGTSPSAAGRSVALMADSLRDALGALGIPRDSIVAAGRWRWWRSRVEIEVEHYRDPATDTQRADTLYRLHEALEVRIRDLTNVGKVIDTALAHGITEFSAMEFSATDTEQAEIEAVADATRKARAYAETIAAASGTRLGRTYSLSTESAYRSYWDEDIVVATQGTAEGRGDTEVVEPVITVRARVKGRWELLEAPERQTQAP